MSTDSDAPGTADGSVEIAAGPTQAGARLDKLLAASLPTLSRSRLKALIEEGAVTLAGSTIGDPGRRVKPGDRYLVTLPEPETAQPAAEAIALSIAYEDGDLVVVDKPAGLVVHPAPGHATGTLVNALLAHCGDSLSGIGGVRRPGIVHRLDKDTSGLLVVAKNDATHKALSRQFQAHGADGRLERRYLALVWGHPLRPRVTVDAPLARSRTSRTRIAVTRGEDGRHAVTHYEVVETFSTPAGRPLAALLSLTLATGRTHQIRVHMAHAGHPVLGDPVYATGRTTSAMLLGPRARSALARLDRQALHAAFLGFEHPATGRRLDFESPLPPDFSELLAALREEAGAVPRATVEKRRK